MPGKEGEPPSPQQLRDLRERALNKIEEVGSGSFLPEDVAKIARSDQYVTRFWLHVFDLPGDQSDEACNMIIETLKWRKTFGTDKVNYESINPVLFDKGTVYTHNRDKDGKKLLTFWVGKHEKGKENMDELKRYFVYYLERLEREEKGEEITIVFDCRNAGLKNMDMEFIQFIIGVFKDYYPQMLNYILVFDMPWVLNAAWKVIKAWLPPAAVKKIKFLTKSNMNEYIDDNNRLECWGGKDPWEYVFEPEVVQPEAPMMNGTSDGHEESMKLPSGEDNLRKKSVTFAEVRSSPSVDSFASSYSTQSSGPDILKLNPSQEVVFSTTPSGELLARVHLTNISEKKVGFKIKTTSPEKYRVRPSSGILKPGQDVNVELHVSGQGAPVTLLRDKFLVTVIYIDDQETNNARLQELLKTTKPEAQYRIRCQMASEQSSVSAVSKSVTGAAVPVDDATKQLNMLLRKINQLSDKTAELEGQLTSSFRIQIVFLVLTVILLILVWIYLPSQQCIQSGAESLEGPAGSDEL